MNIVKKTIYNMIRNKLLKRMTNNLGEIIEEEDKIICNVSFDRLLKIEKNLCYDLIFFGNSIIDKETMKLYNLNKPVHFVLKDIVFKNHLSIVASDTVDFTFEKCIFNDEITIREARNVTLKNNTYKNSSRYIFDSAWFLTIVNCKSLKFINDNFINKYHGNNETKFGMNVNVDNLEINNSKIAIRKVFLSPMIDTKKMTIKNSNIYCDDYIYINADEIKTDNSIVKSKMGIEIINENNNTIMGFKSPQTIYNDVDVSKCSKITEETCQLEQARHTLIDRLKEIRDFCDDMNIEQLEKKENELYNQNVYELIKK